MLVRVRTKGGGTAWGQADDRPVRLRDSATVQELLEGLGLVDEPVMVVVNKAIRRREDPLAEGDLVEILPMLPGG